MPIRYGEGSEDAIYFCSWGEWQWIGTDTLRAQRLREFNLAWHFQTTPISSPCAPAEARRWFFFDFSQRNLESLVGNLAGNYPGFFLTHRTKPRKFRGNYRSIFREKIRSSKKIFRAKLTLQTCHLNNFRDAPDTFNHPAPNLRDASMRALWSFRPKYSHRCHLSEGNPLKTCAKSSSTQPRNSAEWTLWERNGLNILAI